MMIIRNIRDPRTLEDGIGGYLADVEVLVDGVWRDGTYVARPGDSAVADAILAAVAAGDFAGAVAPLPTAPASPPDMLQRAAFWLYLLALGITRPDVHAAIDAALAAETMTAAYAARLRIKVDDATIYERLDPDLLDMAQRLGLAADQAALDTHFIAANS